MEGSDQGRMVIKPLAILLAIRSRNIGAAGHLLRGKGSVEELAIELISKSVQLIADVAVVNSLPAVIRSRTSQTNSSCARRSYMLCTPRFRQSTPRERAAFVGTYTTGSIPPCLEACVSKGIAVRH